MRVAAPQAAVFRYKITDYCYFALFWVYLCSHTAGQNFLISIEMSQGFPGMLGMSSSLSLSLIIFAEFFCSIVTLIFRVTYPPGCYSADYRAGCCCFRGSCRSSVRRTGTSAALFCHVRGIIAHRTR